MNKSKPLHIKIEHPCSQNWNAMQPKDNGRFCSSCKKTIIDFSGLSDTELFKFFQTHSDVTCGRFHNDQLNKDILPAYPKNFVLKRFYNTAAVLLALLTMKNGGATINKKENIITIQPVSVKDQAILVPEKIIISGNVKDPRLNNIENAEIKFGDSIVARTDANGNFEFEITDKEIKPSLLFVGYHNLVTTVRNYHPAMLSTRYDIILSTPETCQAHTMGIRMSPRFETMTLDFNKSTALNDETIFLLIDLAGFMRNNPTLHVNIIAYSSKNTSQSVAQKRLNKVKEFLTDKEGISEERFKLIVEKYSAEKQNTIEVQRAEQEN